MFIKTNCNNIFNGEDEFSYKTNKFMKMNYNLITKEKKI